MAIAEIKATQHQNGMPSRSVIARTGTVSSVAVSAPNNNPIPSRLRHDPSSEDDTTKGQANNMPTPTMKDAMPGSRSATSPHVLSSQATRDMSRPFTKRKAPVATSHAAARETRSRLPDRDME